MRLIDADAFEDVLNDKLLPILIKKYGEEEALRGLHFSFRDVICNIQAQPTINQWDGKSLVCNINNDMKVIVDAKTIKEIHKEGEPVVIELETEKNRIVMTVYDKEETK